MHAGYIIISKVYTPTLPIKNKTNNDKHVICQLYNLRLQKEVKSNPKNSPAVKKVWGPQECCDVTSKVAAKKWL